MKFGIIGGGKGAARGMAWRPSRAVRGLVALLVLTLCGCGGAGISSPLPAPSLFTNPMWVAVDQQGHVYVAGDRDIVKVSPSGKALATWDRKGTRGAWDLSGGVAVAPGGPVYAVSASGRLVQAFTPDGRVVREWGTRKGSPGRLIGPLGVSVAPNRMVVVADERAGRIVTFSPSGRLLRQWGRQCRQGTKGCPWYSGPFHAPTDVAVDRRGNIYVADGVEGGGSRVIKLSPSGRRLWQRNLLSPVGIAVDRKGTIYVAELGLGRVVKLSGGRIVATWQ